MVKCAVNDCKNYDGDKCCTQKLKFFLFPKDVALREIWLKACGENVLIRAKTPKICSVHFTEQDYRLQDILLKPEWAKWRLKEGAFPTLNLPREKDVQVNTSDLPEEKDEKVDDVEEDTTILPKEKHVEVDTSHSEELRQQIVQEALNAYEQ